MTIRVARWTHTLKSNYTDQPHAAKIRGLRRRLQKGDKHQLRYKCSKLKFTEKTLVRGKDVALPFDTWCGLALILLSIEWGGAGGWRNSRTCLGLGSLHQCGTCRMLMARSSFYGVDYVFSISGAFRVVTFRSVVGLGICERWTAKEVKKLMLSRTL